MRDAAENPRPIWLNGSAHSLAQKGLVTLVEPGQRTTAYGRKRARYAITPAGLALARALRLVS